MNSNLIILPGNGPKNKEWAEKARDFFYTYFKSVTIQYYNHWSNKSDLIDMDMELNKLTNTANSLNGNMVILAKSIGTALIMYAVYSRKIDQAHIARCVFVGLPPEWARTNGFDIDGWSAAFTVPTTLVQNNNDPVAKTEDIQKEQIDGKFNNITLIGVKGDDHVYGDFDEIKKYLIE